VDDRVEDDGCHSTTGAQVEEHELEIEALKATPFFADLHPEELESVLQMGHHVHFDPGQAIVERGDTSDGMYIVIQGHAQVDVGGRYHDMKAGSFFGEMALIHGGKRGATVKAVDAVQALMIPGDDFRSFLLEHPSVAVTMLETLVRRLHEIQQRVEAWMS
jgi:CRP-like cAMP-binding protein